jgi:hypothetical protein
MNKNYMHTGKCTAHRQITTLSSDHQTLTKNVILPLPTYLYVCSRQLKRQDSFYVYALQQ